MRRLAVEREMTVAFGPALGLDAATWDEFAGDLALTCGEGADRAPVIAGEREAVAIFVAGWLLAWALTPVVAVIRFVRGDISELRGRGILDRVVRAQQYGRSQSLKVLMSVSVAATAAVPGVGIAANASLAGAALGAPGQPMTSTVVRIARAEVAAAATGHLVASTVAEMAAGASTAGALPAPLAQLLASTSTASLGTQASSYTVRAGDSLSDIAEQFGATVASLAAANGIANPNRISTGEVLKIQLAPYTVAAGDTLTAIGLRVGRSVAELAAANGITDVNFIRIGQVLEVGGGSLPAVPLHLEAPPAAPKPAPATKPAAAPKPAPATKPAAAATRAVVPRPRPAAVAASMAITEPAVPPLVGSGTYTVRAGDTLDGIAAEFDTTAASLAQANHLVNANAILAGQVLQVGGQGANSPALNLASVASPRPAPPPRRSSSPARSARHPRTITSTSDATGRAGASTSFSSLEACVIRAESSGNPQVVNAFGYWGLFQFSKSTWVEYGGSPSEFGKASAAEQEAVFAIAIADGGAFNWTLYDGC
jgi:LysM repeat protein